MSMPSDRPIAELLERDQPVVSVEFFPPKDDASGDQILKTAGLLQEQVRPDFVSITYGAGGSTQERTRRFANILREDYGFEVMPHLTCVGATRNEICAIVEDYAQAGIRNIMALRGDPPTGQTEFVAVPDGLRYASDLVTLLADRFPEMCLGVAGYPEVHPEAPSAASDLQHLVAKVDCGASFVTTQLFFDNAAYYQFVEQARAAGLTAPILPGIMPVLSLKQIERFCGFCGACLPQALIDELKAADGDLKAERQVGVRWAKRQIEDLLQNGAPGVHLYILNRSKSALELIAALRDEGSL